MVLEEHTSLFPEDFGKVESPEDLLDLHSRFPEHNLSYLCQSAAVGRQTHKQWMESLWVKYESFSDLHFLSEFKHNFTARSWELYLGATLLNRGFYLKSHKSSEPDLDVRDEVGKRLTWIEAVTSSLGTGEDRLEPMPLNAVYSVDEKTMALRVAQSIADKYKQHFGLSQNIVSDGDPYVIAINRSRLQYHDNPLIPLILQVVFPIGDLTLQIPVSQAGNTETTSFWVHRPFIKKKSGKSVEMRFFMNKEYSRLSAVIYCVDNILNSPSRKEEMGNNFVIVHNPLAVNPLPFGFFPFGIEYRIDAQGEPQKVDRNVVHAN